MRLKLLHFFFLPLLFCSETLGQQACRSLLTKKGTPYILREAQAELQNERRLLEDQFSRSLGKPQDETLTALENLFYHPRSLSAQKLAFTKINKDHNTSYLSLESKDWLISLLESQVFRPKQALIFVQLQDQLKTGAGPLSPTNIQRAHLIVSHYLIERGLLKSAKRIEEDPHFLNIREAHEFITSLKQSYQARRILPRDLVLPQSLASTNIVDSQIRSFEELLRKPIFLHPWRY